MRDRFCLGGVGNSELLAGLSALVKRGREIDGDVLAHLAELEERGLHLELGYSCLFNYCVETLGMCHSSAGRRVTAVRVCRKYPGVFAMVAQGKLHLSALCALSPHLTDENAAELFATSTGKSRRHVEELLAARFPKPDSPDCIRRLPTLQVQQPAVVLAMETRQDQPPPAGLNLNARPSKLRPPPPRTRVEPLSTDRYGFHFTGNAQLKEKIEQARALASHRLSSGDLAALLELALDTFIQEMEKRRFGVGRKQRTAKATLAKAKRTKKNATGNASGPHLPGETATDATANASGLLPPGGTSTTASDATEPTTASDVTVARHSRYVPAEVRREVYARDGGRCRFVSRDGRRCGARAFVEIDHAQPFADGGRPSSANLRIYCRNHNQLHARARFGKRHIARAVAHARSTAAARARAKVHYGPHATADAGR